LALEEGEEEVAMASKTRTILRRRPKGLGGKAGTGQKARIQPPAGEGRASDEQPESGVELSKTATIRTQVSEDFAQELETIVNYGGLWNSVAELVRDAVRKERDRRIHEALRKKKAAEQEEARQST
jgi:Arc/MetJ-type ribon-helix-helix transcriptional regulator